MTEPRKTKPRYHRASHAVTAMAGHPVLLVSVVSAIGGWIAIGVWTDFPNQWFLMTNLLGTLAIFLLLLILRFSQKIHIRAIHTKLDELIRVSEGGNHMIGSERLADELLEELRAKHRQMVSKDRL